MSERGSMLPYLGALFFVGFVVVGLALDTALLAATYQEAAFAADAGAEAGAARLEADSAYDGGMQLDRPAAIDTAEAAARSAQSRTGRTASASTDGISVCVVVTDHYVPRILGAIGIGAEGVSVRACATPGKG